jgi:hypothetical protein
LLASKPVKHAELHALIKGTCDNPTIILREGTYFDPIKAKLGLVQFGIFEMSVNLLKGGSHLVVFGIITKGGKDSLAKIYILTAKNIKTITRITNIVINNANA